MPKLPVPAEITDVNQKGTHILVVEDDDFLRELIVGKLKNEGFRVSQAIDGKEGLYKLREEQPQLVLLDLILPGIDGFEVLHQAHIDPIVSSIPIIVLSNLGQKGDIDRAKENGAVGYLVKAHFTPSQIIEKVQEFLQELSSEKNK